jgi:hypothetical protein
MGKTGQAAAESSMVARLSMTRRSVGAAKDAVATELPATSCAQSSVASGST